MGTSGLLSFLLFIVLIKIHLDQMEIKANVEIDDVL